MKLKVNFKTNSDIATFSLMTTNLQDHVVGMLLNKNNSTDELEIKANRTISIASNKILKINAPNAEVNENLTPGLSLYSIKYHYDDSAVMEVEYYEPDLDD